jgi:hypothetical protein
MENVMLVESKVGNVDPGVVLLVAGIVARKLGGDVEVKLVESDLSPYGPGPDYHPHNVHISGRLWARVIVKPSNELIQESNTPLLTGDLGIDGIRG